MDHVHGVGEFLGKAGTANAVSESGLYRLIMRADGAKAKPFRDWVVRGA
jgi:prophage antirepressor-like protein